MKIKLARIKVTYEEVDIPHKCPSCNNRFDNEKGRNKVRLHGMVNTSESSWIIKNNNEYSIHWANDADPNHLRDDDMITGVSCDACGEVIVEIEEEKEYASKEELDHLKKVLGL